MSFIFEPFNQRYPDEDVVIYKGKLPRSGGPHTLTVLDEDMYVTHIFDCLDEYGEPACDVAWHEYRLGLEHFFRYPEGELPVGRYQIEAWSKRAPHHGYGAYDGGLVLCSWNEPE